MKIPAYVTEWFKLKNWRMRSYQKAMFTHFNEHYSTLLIAPPGAGKTLASFLPSLVNIHEREIKSLHTLYISPLKALTYDIERNLLLPIKEMQLNVKVATRTGDTSTYQKQRQRTKPPHILLTTPESLMLLLSYSDANSLFKNLRMIIVDEVHSLIGNKRGDLTILAITRLYSLAPGVRLCGLSATVANPITMSTWLSIRQQLIKIIEVKIKQLPRIKILTHNKKIPYFGVMAHYAIPNIYQTIAKNKTTLIFVNTRAQAEFIFQQLWDRNHLKLPIAIYHGSLDKLQRLNVQKLANKGQLRAIISTSALELGIDWGNIDQVLQIGAPKGISRLLQRIGRANHQLNRPSRAQLVPANCFELLECQAAMHTIQLRKLDGGRDASGSLDVAIQYIINCACSGPIVPLLIYQEICATAPYRQLTQALFEQLLQVAINGGYVLQHYDRYRRLQQTDANTYQMISPQFSRQHRQNIGTIIEAPTLQVKLINKRGVTWLGQIDEKFVQSLVPGDTFIFAGKNVEYVTIKDMVVRVKLAKTKANKVVSYTSAKMPLTTDLATTMLELIANKAAWACLPAKVQHWLNLQHQFSTLPSKDQLLIEYFPYKKYFYTIIHTFEGRIANNTLGMLLIQRMEKLQLKPLSFTVTDYAVAIKSIEPLAYETIHCLLTIECIEQEMRLGIRHQRQLNEHFDKSLSLLV